MSYSKRSNESDSLSVTPLLEVSPVNVIDVNTSAFQLPEVEYFNDTYTFEMNDADTKQHSGGTGLLRAFATCPFQAFARYRLGLKHWDEPDEGMTPQETGVANHRALELAWQEIGNSDALLALDDEKLNALCRRVVDEVERLYIHELYHLDAIVEIEKHRLYRSLLQWLTMEQAVQRSAFSVVATELEMAVTLNQFEFKFQIDRVDKTDTNEFIVIDYKSSQPKVKSLLSDDPDEWQLPLYVLGYSENVLAVSYGIVGTQKPKLIGIRDDTIHFKGLDSVTSAPVESLQSWPAITASWKTKISDMLTRYSSGYANVEPKNRSSSCLYCQFQTLCRIETLDQEECNG